MLALNPTLSTHAVAAETPLHALGPGMHDNLLDGMMMDTGHGAQQAPPLQQMAGAGVGDHLENASGNVGGRMLRRELPPQALRSWHSVAADGHDLAQPLRAGNRSSGDERSHGLLSNLLRQRSSSMLQSMPSWSGCAGGGGGGAGAAAAVAAGLDRPLTGREVMLAMLEAKEVGTMSGNVNHRTLEFVKLQATMMQGLQPPHHASAPFPSSTQVQTLLPGAAQLSQETLLALHSQARQRLEQLRAERSKEAAAAAARTHAAASFSGHPGFVGGAGIGGGGHGFGTVTSAGWQHAADPVIMSTPSLGMTDWNPFTDAPQLRHAQSDPFGR